PGKTLLRLVTAEPQNELERQLAQIWKDLLGLAEIGRDDNFHDLGGHSLLVAKLLTRIERHFGRRLSMASLFHAPTLKAMAALLAESATAKPQPRLAPIQPKGTRPPLFWLFGGATVKPLAEAMGEDQPFFGVGLDRSEEDRLMAATTLAEFATPLMRTIRDAQPNGPYFIGGWCTAGILAYEVARRLMQEGSEVGLLMLVHSANPVHYRRIGTWPLRFSKLRYHLSTLRRLDGAQRWHYAIDRLQGIAESVGDRFRPPQAVAQSLSRVLDNAALRYEPPSYAGDVALFQPSDRPDVLDYRPGWRGVVRGAFASFEIPGGHRTMLEAPYVAELARRMSACLRRAQMQTDKRGVEQRRRAAG
ncbi:MAG TPA: phosphopantetheine-binding protein, partial [Stellaceae bacterium]|nr:phosphopantetheine-binding protein [Stellaceae bacterium]